MCRSHTEEPLRKAGSLGTVVHTCLVLLLGVALSAPSATAQQYTAEPDITFNPWAGANDRVNVMVKDGDRILIGGVFTTYNDVARNGIARLHADGAIDESFDPGTGFGGILHAQVNALAVLPDGGILVGGNFTTFNGVSRTRIAKLLPNGALDPAFDPGAGADGTVTGIVPQPDGRAIICGYFTAYHGVPCGRVARINSDGSLDTTFNTGSGANGSVAAAVATAEGQVVIAGNFASYNGAPRLRIARLNADGTLDATFDPGTGADGWITCMARQTDGNILIGGEFTLYDGTARHWIARLSSNGSLDTSFDPGTGATGVSPARVNTMTMLPDGSVFVGGVFTQYNGTACSNLVRIGPDGQLDPTFACFLRGAVNAILPTADGGCTLAGSVSYARYDVNSGTTRYNITQVRGNGSLDLSFNPGVGTDGGGVNSMALAADGKLLVGGSFLVYNGEHRRGLARIHPDGALDTTYHVGTGLGGTAVIYPSSPTALCMAEQADGKVVVGGIFNSYNGTNREYIMRTWPDGSIDTDFDPGSNQATWIGKVHTVSIQSDGKIIAGGTNRNCITRINPDGSPDATFNVGGGANHHVASSAVLPDGRILIGGGFTTFNGEPRGGIARLNVDGSLDPSFTTQSGISGGTYPVVYTLLPLPDGKIIIGGGFYRYDGILCNGLAKLNADGTLDATFTSGLGSGAVIYSMDLVPGTDHIIIGGILGSYSGVGRRDLARVDGNGTLVSMFDTGVGPNSPINTLLVLPDQERIMIGGGFTSYRTTLRNGMMRLGGAIPSVGIMEREHMERMTVFPNPATNTLNLASGYMGDEQVLVRVFNGVGQEVLSTRSAPSTSSTGISISIGALAPGVYTVRMDMGDQHYTSRFIKE